jgi:hypothetical protein
MKTAYIKAERVCTDQGPNPTIRHAAPHRSEMGLLSSTLAIIALVLLVRKISRQSTYLI